MASNPLLNFDNVGPDTSQIKLKQNNLTSFDDIGPNTKTFPITSEGDPKYDRNETADISSIGPGDFDGAIATRDDMCKRMEFFNFNQFRKIKIFCKFKIYICSN